MFWLLVLWRLGDGLSCYLGVNLRLGIVIGLSRIFVDLWNVEWKLRDKVIVWWYLVGCYKFEGFWRYKEIKKKKIWVVKEF